MQKRIAVDDARRTKPRSTASAVLVVIVMVLGVLTLGGGNAEAHNWDGWHWNRGNPYVDIYVADWTGGCGNGSTASNNALYDIYYNPHPVWIWCVNYHTDVELWEANEPYAPYCGLANVWGVYTNVQGELHITHGHARTNTACGTATLTKQGTHCQEFGHVLGLDHSNTGDCMGLSYYSGSNGRYYFGNTGPYVYDWDHQSADLYWRYRYHSSH